MRAFVATLGVLLLGVPAGAWIVMVDGSGPDNRGNAVVVDAAGDVLVGGATQSGSDSSPAFTVAYLARATGAERWRAVLGESATAGFVGALALGPTGDVFAAGVLPDGQALVRLNGTSGAEVWRGGAVGPASAVAADGAGDFIVGGVGVEKLDGATGTERWRAGPGLDAAAVAVAATGDVVAAGADGGLAVVRLDGSTGAERWRRTIAGAAGSPDDPATGAAASAVAVGADGDVYVAGVLGNGRDTDAIVARFDGASGSERWRTVVAAPPPCDSCATDDAFSALALDPAGDPVVAGFTNRGRTDFGPGSAAFTVAKLDAASGAVVWRFDTEPRGVETGRALAIDRSGDIVAAGVTGGGDGCVSHASPFLSTVCQFTVLKLAGGSGRELWRRVLPGQALDSATAVAVAADGTPVATGTTGRSAYDDGHFTVAALDPASGNADHDDQACAGTAACCGGSPISTPRLVVGRLARPDKTTMSFRGTLALRAPVDPAARGVRILIGGLDLVAPAGAGWHRRARGWRFTDRSRAASLATFSVRTNPRRPGLLVFRGRGRRGLAAAGVPRAMTITVVFDRAGACGTANFPGPAPAPTCVVTRAHGGTLRCR